MSTNSEQLLKLDEVIKTINTVNDTFAYEVYIPSLNKYVLFREITTAQQKKLIKSIIDSPVFNTEFIYAIKDIIKENCMDSTINIDNLTIFDKMTICIMMRSVSVNNILEIKTKCNKCEIEMTEKVDLREVVEKCKKIKVKNELIQDDSKKISANCSIPTILTEYNMEKERRGEVENSQIKDAKDARNLVGNIFIEEMVKYINDISIINGENKMDIDLRTLSMQNRITLIENLPERFTMKIIKFINDITKEINKVKIMNYECPKCKNKVEWEMSIDTDFFTNS